jgi:hypothetical protein
VTIELFERVTFPGADVRPVRAKGTLGMVLAQHVLLPLKALWHPRARFVFPGFPPSPLFIFVRERVIYYVHDAFLITRPKDLNARARLYMARPFKLAVGGLKYFLTNSLKTRAEIEPFVARDAAIALYRPTVGNVFGLDASARAMPRPQGRPLRIVSMGTVEPRKNYGAAARILTALRSRGAPDAELHIVGRAGWGEAAWVYGHSRRESVDRKRRSLSLHVARRGFGLAVAGSAVCRTAGGGAGCAGVQGGARGFGCLH